MSTQLVKRRFTVEQYHQIHEAGILTENDRVELINGEILEIAAIGKLHAAYVDCISNLLYASLGRKVIVRVQNPIIVSNLSEPQPDITIVQFSSDFYRSGLPQPNDILLLIEIAGSSIEYDRDVKIPLYAESGILEVWLVDINQQIIEVYRQPTPTGYTEIKTLNRGEKLSIQSFPEISLNLNDIFG
ncbi:MAG TPA: Uma2 family endonuclease [Nostocaceae cyanobacterium]|nr:Uma2 family endonuclease [Nostocaceae cyanobacterium]